MKPASSITLVALGVLAIALAPLRAEIVYSGPQAISLSRNSYRVNNPVSDNPAAFHLDLNGDGVDDFSFFSQQPVPVVPTLILFGGKPLNSGLYLSTSSSLISTVTSGTIIGASDQLSPGQPGWPFGGSSEIWWPANFYGNLATSLPGESYFGVKFLIGADYHFGWIGIDGFADASSPLTIEDWAYETAAGVAIAAGSQGVPATAVPEPSSYALCGAVALLGIVAGRRGTRHRSR